MSPRKEMVKAVNAVLEPNGFRNKGLSWYLNTDETTCVITLDKSNFGNYYGVALGVNIKSHDPERYPKYYQCHWRGSLYTVTADNKKRDIIIDFEQATPESGIRKTSRGKELPSFYCHSVEVLAKIIESEAIPLFSELRTRNGVLKLYNSGKLWPVPASLIWALGLRE